MIVLNVVEIEKRFGPEPVLDGVTFEVRPGERIGLIGPNGAGKTTLLNILAGLDDADAGTVELHPSCRLAYLEQTPSFAPGRTLWQEALSAFDDLLAIQHESEQVAHQLSLTHGEEHQRLASRYDRLQQQLQHRDAYQLDHKIQRILDGLGFAREQYEQPVETLSGGQKNRLLLAKLLLTEAEVMLLDEPSNHLDLQATEWLESFLSESKQAMILVSHDRFFLDKVTNRTLELFSGTVDDYTGNFSAYWRQKAERLEVQRRTWEKQQAFIAKTEDFIRRNHYGQKHVQAHDREKKLARVERVEPPREIVAPVMGFPPASRTGDVVLRSEGLAKAYTVPLFHNLTFDMLRGQRWGILGPNGAGKSTLLRIIMQQVKADAGRIVLGSGVNPVYYDQMQLGIANDQPVVEAVRPPVGDFNEQQRRDVLARFGITGDAVFQTVGSLSGGERSRAALARLSATAGNFMLLDEPTNHLDLWACDSLERSLSKFDGTVLLVSHDRYFLNRVVDHLLVIEDGQAQVIDGNYDTYLYQQRQRRTPQAAPPTDANASSPSRKNRPDKTARPKRRFPYRKVEDIEAEIFQRETTLEKLHAELAHDDTYRHGDRVREVQAKIEAEQAALKTLYEHWEEASELNS